MWKKPSTAKLTGMGVEQNELTCITCKVPDNDGRSSTAQTQEGQELDENGVEMPPDVDRSVFDALPSNMRDELIAEWKRSKKRKEEESHRQSTPKTSPTNSEIIVLKEKTAATSVWQHYYEISEALTKKDH